MTGETLFVAVLLFVAGFGFYLWGYRSGVRYCVRQMEPLGHMAKKMADDLRNRRP